MAKAVVKTKNGLKIEIEGTPDEITKIVSDVKQKIERMEEAKAIKKAKEKSGATGFIAKLKADGFFNKPRILVEIKDKLAENGLIYPVTTLSAVLIGLVRRRELGRIRTDKGWGYVKR